MTIIQMRDEIINQYGKGSFEAGYIQYVFSHRGAAEFLTAYTNLKKKN